MAENKLAAGELIIMGVCINDAWPKEATPELAGFCPLQVLMRHIESVHAAK
jgi:hypothetical protein